MRSQNSSLPSLGLPNPALNRKGRYAPSCSRIGAVSSTQLQKPSIRWTGSYAPIESSPNVPRPRPRNA
jgi:hypothetical protein